MSSKYYTDKYGEEFKKHEFTTNKDRKIVAKINSKHKAIKKLSAQDHEDSLTAKMLKGMKVKSKARNITRSFLG